MTKSSYWKNTLLTRTNGFALYNNEDNPIPFEFDNIVTLTPHLANNFFLNFLLNNIEIY
ncbi:MAG: hypothetical protein K0S93_660 [Nitrososphaeraceae archaeon]|jgi:hypothetical protein|nr:hypothetical protein [Nitrososphaeraceae archaeon]